MNAVGISKASSTDGWKNEVKEKEGIQAATVPT